MGLEFRTKISVLVICHVNFDTTLKYIENKIIPENKKEDALHVAFAAVYEFDILLSWNFRHLANYKKQTTINAFNRNEGFTKELLLLNPLELIYEKRL